MNHIGLFEGIGGFSLAANWMGWETIAWCEINPFCQQVLKYHIPKAQSHDDIKTTDFSIYRGQCDIVTGGFPCQPYSIAGNRKGKDDDRHLWPEMLRAVREIQPSFVVGENVSGLTNWNGGMVFDEVQADLEAEGYEVTPFLLPACAVNAPHRRDRIWFIAYSDSNRNRNIQRQDREENSVQSIGREAVHPRQSTGAVARITTNPKRDRDVFNSRSWANLHDSHRVYKKEEQQWDDFTDESGGYNKGTSSDSNGGKRCERGMHQTRQQETERYISTRNARNNERTTWDNFPTQPPLYSRNDGVSTELSGITFSKHRNESIKAYGNAIVPQVAFQIFKAIEQLEIIYNTQTTKQ